MEGAAQFLTYLSERARTGSPLLKPRDSCSLANNIAEPGTRGVGHRRNLQIGLQLTLGEGVFLELYDRLGDAAFRQGFRNLHLARMEETGERRPVDECAATDAMLCYFKSAFLAPLTPENAAAAERIIDRRYFGP